MKYVKQFGIIVAISFLGEVLNYLLPLPVPASIYGIVILFMCLKMGWIPPESVKETGDFLVQIMPLMFIPAAVGLVDAWGILRENLLAYVVIIVVSTILVMGITGVVTQIVIQRDKGEQKHE